MTSKTEQTCRALYECVNRIRKAGKHRKLTAELQELLGEHLYGLENENKSLNTRLDEALGRIEIYGDAHRYQVKLTHEACCRERVLFDELYETRRKLAAAESYKQDCIDAEAAADRMTDQISQQKTLIAAQRQAIGQLYMLKATMSRQVLELVEENDILKMANRVAGEKLRSTSTVMVTEISPLTVKPGAGQGSICAFGSGGSSNYQAGGAGANRKCNNPRHHQNCQCGYL